MMENVLANVSKPKMNAFDIVPHAIHKSCFTKSAQFLTRSFHFIGKNTVTFTDICQHNC